MRLGDRAAVPVSTIPTGALSIDLALGVGGVPRGRIIEIFGPESSGKTTLVYEIIAQAQKMGGICAFIDTEHAIDPIYARTIGVDIDELLVSQPDHGEQALEIADVLTRSGAVDVDGAHGRGRLGRGGEGWQGRMDRRDRHPHSCSRRQGIVLRHEHLAMFPARGCTLCSGLNSPIVRAGSINPAASPMSTFRISRSC